MYFPWRDDNDAEHIFLWKIIIEFPVIKNWGDPLKN